ncbi:MAG: hypothetical protein ACKOF7_02900, partial [Phycisphaerales bacterium]
IVTLWLDPSPAKPRGGVVVLDAWLIGAIADACAAIACDGCTGLILASSSTRVFVAGADRAELDALDDAGRHAYLARGAEAFAAIPALAVPLRASQCMASSSPPPSAARWMTATLGTPSAGIAANVSAPR